MVVVVISYFRRERVNYPGIGQSVSGAVDDCGGLMNSQTNISTNCLHLIT